MKKKSEKIADVAELKERLEKSHVAILTKYVGIKAGQVTELRRRLREAGVEFKVFKNTLASRALDELGLSGASKFMEGPTAWAFCADPVAPAKALRDFNKEVPVVEMSGGILEGKVVTKAQLDALATLPPREVLLGQVVGTIAAPIRNLVSVIAANQRNLVNVLDQIRKQKEEGSAAA